MKFLLSLLLAAAAIPAIGIAQHHKMSGDQEMRDHGRLEKFKMMRLVEVLKLKEDEAVRLYAKNSAHEDKVGELMKSRNAALDDLDQKLGDEKEAGNLKALTDKVLDVDQKMFAERQRYQDELRGFLSPERFARYLLFERNFGRRLRTAMDEMHRERGSRGGG
jgi:hypothetical protein